MTPPTVTKMAHARGRKTQSMKVYLSMRLQRGMLRSEFLDDVRRCRISYAGLGIDGVAGWWVIAGDQRFASYLVSAAVSEFDIVMRRLWRFVECLTSTVFTVAHMETPADPLAQRI
jgi:hypothetical protein